MRPDMRSTCSEAASRGLHRGASALLQLTVQHRLSLVLCPFWARCSPSSGRKSRMRQKVITESVQRLWSFTFSFSNKGDLLAATLQPAQLLLHRVLRLLLHRRIAVSGKRGNPSRTRSCVCADVCGRDQGSPDVLVLRAGRVLLQPQRCPAPLLCPRHPHGARPARPSQEDR